MIFTELNRRWTIAPATIVQSSTNQEETAEYGAPPWNQPGSPYYMKTFYGYFG